MSLFLLPDLGEGLQEAEIVTWHVSVGDHVTADQPLVSVETDKAVVEVPAPQSGTVAELFAEEGEVVPVGGQLARIDTGKAKDTGAIVGDLADSARQDAPDVSMPKRPSSKSQARASPAVRKLARERGIDLGSVTGSGPGGTILSKDIEDATSGDSDAGSGLRGVRRSMARAMARSHAEIVPATVTDRADIHTWAKDEAPTPRLVRAIVAACAAEPALNAWFDGNRLEVQEHVDLGIAVDSPEGLFAPVLRDASGDRDIAADLSRLRDGVADRSLKPEAFRGATISLSNFGMLGGEFAALVVSPPQVAILGAGRIAEAVMAVDGRPAVRRVVPLSLTFDHRVVTGGEATRFLAAVRKDLERPTH